MKLTRIVPAIAWMVMSPCTSVLQAQGGPTTLQFSFSNPGARSLGLGGAFAAIADDATAAFANPAGLTQLTRPEVSVEGRYWSYSTSYTSGGRVSGEPTGIGLDGPIRTATSEFDSTSLSFLSFVYPGSNWTLALSRHQSANFEAFSRTQGLFTDDQDDDPQPRCLEDTAVCRYPDYQRQTEADITSTTLSFAYQLSDAFSLGLGLSYYEGSFRMDQDPFLPLDETLPEGFFGPNAYLPEARYGSGLYGFEEGDFGGNLGWLWFPDRQWSVGGFYRQGGEFSGTGVEISGPALDPPIPVGSIGAQEPIRLKMPDVLGVGVAFRSKEGSWTGSFEWDRVAYSQILASIGEADLIGTETVRLDDANELRLGVEYAFRRWTPLWAIRGGVWSNPDHTIRSIERDDPLELALLPGGEDGIHFALGLGIVFKNLQIDLAVDFSDLVDTAALSFIYQF